MNKKLSCLRRRSVAQAVYAALATFTLPAVADPLLGIKLFRDSEIMFRDDDLSRWTDNYVEIGSGYNSNDSFKFGQFSGIVEQGSFPIFGLNFVFRDPKNDAKYLTVHGANLGLDSRKFDASTGVQGQWGAKISLDQLTKYQTESSVFLHNGLGTNQLTLPGGTTYNDATQVNTALLKPFGIKHGRDVFKLDLTGLVASNWDYKVNYREDRRDGTRLTGLPNRRGNRPTGATPPFNATSGSGISMIVPYPIDDHTRQMEAVLGFTTKTTQIQLSYTISQFENQLNEFNVQNPYNAGPAGSYTSYTDVPNLRMSLAPDNDYQQIAATAAHNFSKATRLTGKITYGVGTQNEAFLPFSANGTAATTALPKSSLDGKVVNTTADLALMTRPNEKSNIKLGYQFRDSDNQTPIVQVTYASRDSTAVGGTARRNAPVSTTEQKVLLEGDYQVGERTILLAGVDRTNKTYTLTDREETDTDRINLQLRRTFSDEFIGGLNYTYTQRTGSDYNKINFVRQTYAAANALTNHPSMRSYMYSDYDENKIRASGNWAVTEQFSVQAGLDASRQTNQGPNCGTILDPAVATAMPNMPDVCLGRKYADAGSANLDMQWQVEENLTTFAFGNYSETRFEQIGRSWNTGTTIGGINQINVEAANAQRDYTVISSYKDTTVGAGFKWQAVQKWSLGGTYVNQTSKGTTKLSAVNPALFTQGNTISDLPDLKTTLHQVQLFAKFDQNKQVSWRFNYVYENLKTNDWSYDDLNPTVNPSVLQTGQATPRYVNHLFGISATIAF